MLISSINSVSLIVNNRQPILILEPNGPEEKAKFATELENQKNLIDSMIWFIGLQKKKVDRMSCPSKK